MKLKKEIQAIKELNEQEKVAQNQKLIQQQQQSQQPTPQNQQTPNVPPSMTPNQPGGGVGGMPDHPVPNPGQN